jgi:hypothetical protein
MPPSQIYSSATELADLGTLRLDHDTAAPSDRDYALLKARGKPNTNTNTTATTTTASVVVAAGRAPRGLESQVFAWNAFRYTTDERSARDEAKADLHAGQLHRLNRVAGGAAGELGGNLGGAGGQWGAGAGATGGGERRMGKGNGKGKGVVKSTAEEGLCAGRKPDGFVSPPLAKGAAEELGRELFWDGEIV